MVVLIRNPILEKQLTSFGSEPRSYDSVILNFFTELPALVIPIPQIHNQERSLKYEYNGSEAPFRLDCVRLNTLEPT